MEAQTQANTAEANENTGLLEQIMSQTRMDPDQEEYSIAKRGLAEFISEMLRSDDTEQHVNKGLIDQVVAELDAKLSTQVDEILHAPEVQQLESSWRSLRLLVDRTNFRENVVINILHVTKEELLDDFEFSPDLTQSGLYKHVYSSGYGQFGGEPVGAIVGNYTFSPSTPDIKLLHHVASVGAMAHAPFLAAAGSEFFNIDSYEELGNIKEVKSIFEGPRLAKWRGLRESEDARYLGLTMPRFLLRSPYDPVDNPVRSFNYQEAAAGVHDNYLWGNTAFLMAARITDSFAKFRWCPNIIGPQSGGAVDDLPMHNFEAFGDLQAKIPTETLITDRKEFEIAEEGFIPLTMRKDSDNASFFSANSVQLPKKFQNTKEGKQAETNYKLGTMLPYMFIINRLAHYIKVLQREQLGSWKERQDLERELNTWLKQYVADQENPPADVRSRRPLRSAQLNVADVEGEPGWYKVTLSVRPHFKYMGASFELSLVGKLDKDT
ncbi:MAG: type VI secretion system contractile sheath large subunit [Thiomicrorhabdus sp.]|nr:type VI secretion system contractile sheath large subunit [Thiomicrorhabdus sp.]